MNKLFYLLLLLPTVLRAQSIAISTPTDTVCTGTPVTFTAIATGILSPHYQWKINSTNAGLDSVGFTISTLTDGDTIKSLLTNSSGSIVYATSSSIVMTVENMPDVGVITGQNYICEGTSITLVDTVAGGVWSTLNHYVSDSGGVITILIPYFYGSHSLFDSIYYTVANSCGFDKASFEIEIAPIPNAVFYLDDLWGVGTLCVGQTILVNRGSFYGDIHSKKGHIYSGWEPGGVGVTGMSPGFDTLYNIVTNVCGADTFYMPVQVRSLPSTPSPIIAPSTEICVGESIQLTDTSTNLGLWNWAVSNNNLKLNTFNGTITGLNPGLDTAIFVVNNGCGISSASIAITINPPGQILGPDTLCKDQSTTLSNAYPGGTWSSSNPAIATISQDGQMTCLAADTVYISYALGSCTVTKKEVINTLPLLSGNRDICPNEETTLTTSLSGKKWLSANTDAATIDSFGNIKGINHGNSLISFTANNGCATSIELTVNPLPATITGDPGICLKRGTYLYNEVPGGKWSSDRPYIAAVDSLSGFVSGISDGVANITYTLPTGCNITRQVITTYCYEEQSIFPNPASHEITIEADTAIYFEYAIINYMGQMITRAPITATFTTLDISMLPRGFYFIYLWGKVYLHGDHRMHIQRFIKQ